MRAGAYALSLLTIPLNVQILRSLERAPLPLTELRRVLGSPPPTTVRGHLKRLAEAGLLERRRQAGFPGAVHYDLREAGRELLAVAAVLEAWLAGAPEGPLALAGRPGRAAVKALVDGWAAAIVRALAARQLSLTELSRLLSGLNYPSLERRLGALRLAGLIEPRPGPSRGTPYGVTGWLRRAVAPLLAAARWERRHAAGAAPPIGRIEVEAGFLLALPLLRLPAELAGGCRLAVELGPAAGNGEPALAGVLVGVEDGRVVSCVSRLGGPADGWSSGTAPAWLSAVIDREPGLLELGGDCALARGLLDGLHGALFGAGRRI